MRRNYWVVVANVLVIGVLTGCSDSMLAPSATPGAAPTSMMFAPAGRPSLSLSGGAEQNGTIEFTVDPSGGVFFVGDHALYFPARSICDPASSSYGANSWDIACTPLDRPITVTARVSTRNGVKAVDFTPELRFVASSQPSQWVWLFMYTPEARDAFDLSEFSILYAQTPGATLVDDAVEDPTVRTYVDTWSGASFRRIKHFSGYAVASGRACEEGSTEEGCVQTPTQ